MIIINLVLFYLDKPHASIPPISTDSVQRGRHKIVNMAFKIDSMNEWMNVGEDEFNASTHSSLNKPHV